jgi:hypothetical protein
VKTKIMRLTIAAAALAAAMCSDIPASRAFGDAPWCSVKSGGDSVYWDCEYRTFEACYPNGLADRGGCYLNPSPGPTTATTAAYPRHQKLHGQQN